MIDEVELKDYDLNYLRSHFGTVPQEPMLFSGTIEENIIYGVDNYRMEELEKNLKIANAYDFITNKKQFPEGLNTLVGERGVKLSGGQKQRIAIARALMMKPKILIFDEATSALDAESEFQVQKSIDNLIKMKSITIIVVAHRLSTIKNCNRIIMLENGKIVEDDNHENLFKIQNGKYKKLVSKQMTHI